MKNGGGWKRCNEMELVYLLVPMTFGGSWRSVYIRLFHARQVWGNRV